MSRLRNVEPDKTLDESIMVYSLEYNSPLEEGKMKFLPRPVTYVATPGVACIIEL